MKSSDCHLERRKMITVHVIIEDGIRIVEAVITHQIPTFPSLQTDQTLP